MGRRSQDKMCDTIIKLLFLMQLTPVVSSQVCAVL